MTSEPEGGPYVEITGIITVVNNYRFFHSLANEMAYRAGKERELDEAAAAFNEYRYSIAAVIFSFTYIEGYFDHLMFDPNSPTRALFSEMSKRLRDRLERLPLSERIEYVALHHPSSKFSKSDIGGEPYRSFILLTELRNWLIHYKPREEVRWSTREDYQNAWKDLENKVTGKFAFNPKMEDQAFFFRCFSSDCARWAFEVSRTFTDWLSETLSVKKPALDVRWPLSDDSL